jgi:diguanylate cyclase (GGDEF)-like protein
MFQLTAWSLPSLAALLIGLHTLRTLPGSGNVPGASAIRALAWCVMIWSAGQFFGTLTTSLTLKVLSSKLQYPGITLLPVAWVAFAVTYVRRRYRLQRLTMSALFALPAITVALAWTNELHGWIWTDIRLNPLPGFIAIAIDYGPWFRVHTAFAYALVTTATVILAFDLSASRHHRRALFAVIVAPGIVVSLNLLHLTRWNPFPYIDPTPLGFALGMMIMSRHVLRSGLLQLSPVLHRQVVEQLSDGVLIIDAGGRIIDLNPAARAVLPRDAGWAVGQTVQALLSGTPVQRVIDGDLDSAELEVAGRTFHVKASRLDPDEPGTKQTVLVLRDITERLEAENALRQVKQDMERLAHTDALTGLHNRRHFMNRLNEETERVRRHGNALSVLLLDLDRFKSINDTYGHDAGDRVLQQIAEVIAGCARVSDVTARLGGEEFALALPETSIDGALRLAERLRSGIADAVMHVPGTDGIHVTTSIGVATLSPSTPSAASLLQQADRALYAAKGEGRNRVHCARQ